MTITMGGDLITNYGFIDNIGFCKFILIIMSVNVITSMGGDQCA